jgi:hypothetical protein
MNLEHSKDSIQVQDKRSIGLIEALAKSGNVNQTNYSFLEEPFYGQRMMNHNSQIIPPIRNSVQNLTSILPNGSTSTLTGVRKPHRFNKNSIHASIDDLKLNWLKEKEERNLFNQQFALLNTSSVAPPAQEKIDEKAMARRQRNHI